MLGTKTIERTLKKRMRRAEFTVVDCLEDIPDAETREKTDFWDSHTLSIESGERLPMLSEKELKELGIPSPRKRKNSKKK